MASGRSPQGQSVQGCANDAGVLEGIPVLVRLDTPDIISRYYGASVTVAGKASPGAQLDLAFRPTGNTLRVEIYLIRCRIYHEGAAGTGASVGIRRSGVVTGGATLNAGVPRDTRQTLPSGAEFVTGFAPTTATALVFEMGSTEVTTGNLGGPIDEWVAVDREDRIVLSGDQVGIAFFNPLDGAGPDTDNRYKITFGWEAVPV